MPPRRGHPASHIRSRMSDICFNSCPREGGIHGGAVARKLTREVSTRAPAKGASLRFPVFVVAVNGFNSCPREGGIGKNAQNARCDFSNFTVFLRVFLPSRKKSSPRRTFLPILRLCSCAKPRQFSVRYRFADDLYISRTPSCSRRGGFPIESIRGLQLLPRR